MAGLRLVYQYNIGCCFWQMVVVVFVRARGVGFSGWSFIGDQGGLVEVYRVARQSEAKGKPFRRDEMNGPTCFTTALPSTSPLAVLEQRIIGTHGPHMRVE